MPRHDSILPGEVQAYICVRFGTFAATSQIKKEVLEQFGLEVTPQQLSHYNAATSTGQRNLAEDLKKVFWEARESFLKNLENIPIANAAVRLKRLDFLANKARKAGDIPMESHIIEQAAKEVGGMFVNPRRAQAAGGKVAGGVGRVVPVFMIPSNGRDAGLNAESPKKRLKAPVYDGAEVLDGEEGEIEETSGEGMVLSPELVDAIQEKLEEMDENGELEDRPPRAFDAPDDVTPLRRFEDGY